MKFHDNVDGTLKYWIEPRMGLRRFIFYDKSRKNGSASIDETAYKKMLSILKKNIIADTENEKQEIIEGMLYCSTVASGNFAKNVGSENIFYGWMHRMVEG